MNFLSSFTEVMTNLHTAALGQEFSDDIVSGLVILHILYEILLSFLRDMALHFVIGMGDKCTFNRRCL